jgi:microcystin-dependent protein
MPIVIQDLIAADTVSQAVDKINFNFDQLILNGGGPAGPAGPVGPTGPVGGRGNRGATWYKDNIITPGSNPNSLIIIGVNEDDYFLRSNGQVWQYNGAVWVQTVVDLLGPQGLPGAASGFSYAGGFPGGASINNQNAAYLVPMSSGLNGGAAQNTNQGISSVLFGAVASNAPAPAGINFTSAFQIPDAITKSLDASVLTMLIHQKDSASSSIRFMGGGVAPTDKYEQAVLTDLSNITLGIDDSFDINVPKAATSPGALSDLIGFNLNTLRKGQQFYSGKQIIMISGADGAYSGLSSEISDISFMINTSNPSLPAKFVVSTTVSSATSLFEIGGSITIPTSTNKTGKVLIETGEIGLVGATNISLRRSTSQFISLSVAGVILNDQSTILNEITGTGNTVLVQYGAGITIPTSTTKTGKALIETGEIGLVANSIKLNRGAVDFINITGAGTVINNSSLITIQTTTPSTFTGRIVIGAVQSVPITSDKLGSILIDATDINLLGNQNIKIGRSSTQFINISPSGINIVGTTSGIKLTGQVMLVTQPTTVSGTNQLLVRDDVTGEVMVAPGNPGMPVGAIIMWSGGQLPTGWYLCNGAVIGTTITPDLRGRFIVGQDPQSSPQPFSSTDYAIIGATGGLKDVTLDLTQMPVHSHAFPGDDQLSLGNGAGTPPYTWAARANIAFAYDVSSKGSGNGKIWLTSDSGGFGGSGSGTPPAITQAHENRPPYYVLAFIIYLGV